jgi:hypothetical protein
MKNAKFILTGLLYVFCLQAHAGLLYNYSQLALKDLDQMNKIVQDKVKESKHSSSGKTVPLKEALQAVYSRPNDDGMIEKIIAPLRSGLDEHDAWEKTISQLTDEAVSALKHPKAFKPVIQVTYCVFLENLLADMKPYLDKPGFERTIAEKIRNADIEVSKEAINERNLRSMKSTTSPSEIAKQLLSQSSADSAKKEQ